MTKWKLNKFTMNEDVYIEERPQRAAPRPPRGSCKTSDEAWPLGSRAFYEKVNPYWLDQAARRPRFSCTIQATSSKPQATSRKRARPEVNSWEWRDTLQKKAASAQGHKLDKKIK